MWFHKYLNWKTHLLQDFFPTSCSNQILTMYETISWNIHTYHRYCWVMECCGPWPLDLNIYNCYCDVNTMSQQLAIFLSLYHSTRVDAVWFRFSDNHQSSEHLNHQPPHFSNSNGLQPSSRDARDKLTARKAPTEVVKPKLEEAREMMSCLIRPLFFFIPVHSFMSDCWTWGMGCKDGGWRRGWVLVV